MSSKLVTVSSQEASLKNGILGLNEEISVDCVKLGLKKDSKKDKFWVLGEILRSELVVLKRIFFI